MRNGMNTDDQIYNEVRGEVINALAGNDTIESGADNVSVSGGDGDDSIRSAGSNVTLDGDAGNDIIELYLNSDNVTINGGAGDDTLNDGGATLILLNGDAGNDFLKSGGNENTLNGGAGADTIVVYSIAEYITVNGGAGNDFIQNFYGSHDISASGGAGNDVIANFANDSTLDGGDGDDGIESSGADNVIIYGGSGDDSILIHPYAGIGYENGDTIEVATGNHTVIGGKGDDVIYGRATVGTFYKYAEGDGNDVIYGFGSSAEDTLQITSGTFTTTKSANNIIVKVGSGSITLRDAANNKVKIIGNSSSGDSSVVMGTDKANTLNNSREEVTVKALAGNDKITNTGGDVVIDAGDGKDTVVNKGEYVTIYGGAGEDSITNSAHYVLINGGTEADAISNSATYVTINGAEGADKITNAASSVSISGGDGNDTISLSSSDRNVTINGGAGTDRIYMNGKGNVYQYASGDGKDMIYNFSTNDTIHITSGKTPTYEVNGNNLELYIGTGQIILNNYKNNPVQVKVGNDAVTTLNGGSQLPSGWKFNGITAQATIASADEIDLNEEYGNNITKVDASKITGGAVVIGNDKGNSIKGGKGDDSIVGGTGDDTISLGAGADVYVYTGGNDLIQDYAQNADTIQVNISNTENLSVETISSNVIFYTDEGEITVQKGSGKKIVLVDENFNEISLGGLPDGWTYTNNKNMVTAKSGAADLDLNESYGDGITKVDASKLSNGIEIIGNGLGNSIKGGKGADTITGGEGDDIVSMGGGQDVYIYTGGTDLIQDYAVQDSIMVDINEIEVTAVETVGTNVIYTTSQGLITIKNGKSKKTINLVDMDGEEITIGGGSKLPDGLEYDTNHLMLIAKSSFKGNAIDLPEIGGDAVDTVVKIDASKVTAHGLEIIGNDLGNSIKGTKNADFITGGEGDDTVSMGGGADVYIYTGGTDLIQDYAVQDSIQIDINEIPVTAFETIGTNFVVTTEQGTITVKNGKNKTVTVMDADGNLIELNPDTLPAGLAYNTNKNMITASTSFRDDVINLEEYGGAALSSVIKIDTSKITGGIEIIGNELGNSIKAGRGNDTITGGTGDDIIYSGNGDDVIIFTGGDDYIADYTAGHDSIMVDVNDIEVTAVETLGTEVVYTTNEGTITVKNGKGKTIKLVDADGDEIVVEPAGVLPNGLAYNPNKTMITVSTAFRDDVINLEEYGGAAIETVIKLDASKLSRGIEIYGNDLGMSIKGGKGADTITGGEGKDTVSLGGGDDIYIFTGGDDLIQDYAAGHDSIMVDINEIEVTAIETVGTGVVYTTSQGTITVKNGKGKTISLVDMDGEDIVIEPAGVLPNGLEYNTQKTMITAKTTFRDDVIDLPEIGGAAADTVTKLDISKLSRGIEIIANDLGMSIKGGKGADIITGGEGNDIISLGGGADTYIFTGGDDLIQDYRAEDTIVFDERYVDFTGVATVGSNVIFSTAQGTLTVKGGKGKAITVVDGDGYDIDFMASSADLFEDENFIGDARIDEISAVDFSVTNIQPSKVDPFAQEQPLLTFDKDK